MKNEMELLFWIVGKMIDSPKVQNIDYKKLFSLIDIDGFISLVIRNKCVPIVYKFVDLFPKKFYNKFIMAYHDFQTKNVHLQEAAKEIAFAAMKDDIKIIEPKGIALSSTIYDNLESRQFGDLDFLVSIEDLPKLGKILVEHGLAHRHNGDIADICNVMAKNTDSLAYEIKFIRFYADGCRIVIELKKATDAVQFSLLPFFLQDLRAVCIEDDYFYHTFSNEGLLLHLCSNIYTDHYKYEGVFADVGKLRDFVDLFFFIKNVKYDVTKFIKLYRTCHLEQCVIFCRDIMLELFDIQIFKDVTFKEDHFLSCILAKKILAQEKKQYFLKKYSENQVFCDKVKFSVYHNFVFSYKSIKIMLNFINTENIGIQLIAPRNVLYSILKERRLYLSFILNLDKNRLITESDINVDTYYEYNQSVCIYLKENTIYSYQDTIKFFSINNATTENDRLPGQKVTVLQDNMSNDTLSMILHLPSNYLRGSLYFNTFTDLQLLKDYYKHDSYLCLPGVPCPRIR